MTQRKLIETSSPWRPGETVVVRGIWRGELWWACPQYVVRDSPELWALYWPAGTPVRRWYRRPTVQEVLSSAPQLVEAVWTDTNVLSLVTPGTAHSIDLMWDCTQHDLRCWYIQLQEPLRRTLIGFDTMDQILDLVISPDRTEWQWKDVDEFAEALSIGVYSAQQAEAIRTEGESVIEKLKANQSPFCDGWERWQPAREWGIPTFPQGWESVPL
jgi:hypothetical protein